MLISKKTLAISVVLVVVALSGLGFLLMKKDQPDNTNSSETALEVQPPASINTETIATIDSVTNALKEGGVELGEKSTPYFSMIGAKDGVKYGIGTDNAIEIYEFENSEKTQQGEKQLQDGDDEIVIVDNVLVLITSDSQELVQRVREALK